MEFKKTETVVLCILYPGIEDYLDDYFSSLMNQSYTDYDVWIFNDGLNKDLLEKYISKYNKLNIFQNILEDTYTPAEIRELAINKIKDKYNYLIFSDADDYFSSNRIEKSIRALQNYDFCYNNMILVDYKGEKINKSTYFNNKDNPILINDYSQLLNKNFCGLSNTAINLKNVNLSFLKIPKEITVVDWWIFSLLLIKGYRGCFINDAFTYYRQHIKNTVGGAYEINEKKLLMGLQVKKEQYSLLLEKYPSKYDILIKKELKDIIILEKKFIDDSYLSQYIENINGEKKEFMWWESIKLKER